MGDITYKEDIIKELSQELNISEKEIKEIVDLNISYIKKNAIEKDFVMINLPNLCKIRLNYRLALSSYAKTKNLKSERGKVKAESLSRKIEILRKYKYVNDTLLNFKKPLFERLWRKFKRISIVNYIYTKMFSMIHELEEKTNEIIQEIR